MKKMKKGYIRLYIFLLTIFLLLLINSFMPYILGPYRMISFLFVLMIIFELIFVFEKDRHRHLKPIVINMFIYLMIYFIFYYLSGILIGFAKSGNYYTLYGLINFIIPTIILIMAKEFFRYGVLCKAEGKSSLIIFSVIVFIMMDISSALAIKTNSYESSFLLMTLTILPSISNNILCSYLATKVGYKVNVIYLLIINLYQYLIPIIPNPNEYIKSIIEIIVPIILLSQFIKYFNIEEDNQVDRDYKKINIPSLMFPLFLTIILVYFVSGYFSYYSIAIASGSMNPKIKVGDVVIIKQKNYNYEDIKVGDIIAYKYNNVIVVHRVVKKIEDNKEYYFYTKGDNNRSIDDWIVNKKDILGIVKFKIPKVGLPTIWLNKSLK